MDFGTVMAGIILSAVWLLIIGCVLIDFYFQKKEELINRTLEKGEVYGVEK